MTTTNDCPARAAFNERAEGCSEAAYATASVSSYLKSADHLHGLGWRLPEMPFSVYYGPATGADGMTTWNQCTARLAVVTQGRRVILTVLRDAAADQPVYAFMRPVLLCLERGRLERDRTRLINADTALLPTCSELKQFGVIEAPVCGRPADVATIRLLAEE